MDLQTLEERYMRVPGMYAKKVGIWPAQSISTQRCAALLLYSVAVFATATQMARVLMDYSLNILLEQLPFLCVPLGAFIKHVSYVCNYKGFREMFDGILEDWGKTKTKKEEDIMIYYANKGVFYSYVYVANGFFVSTIFAFVPLMPYILDFISPLNETRPRVQMYEAYYFVKNQEDYHFFIMVYTVITMLLALVIFYATDTILICTVQHCCGLLALAGHRFEYSLHELSSSSGSTKTDYKKLYRTVSCAIASHDRALTFLLKIENAYKLPLAFLLSASVLTFTTTLLRVGTVTLSTATYQFYAYAVAQIVHMFFLTVQGQFVIDVHEDIYRQGYEALWYNADTRTQSLFILILRQSYSPPLLTAGGIMQLNLDSFAEIIKASVSYFTVLRSV